MHKTLQVMIKKIKTSQNNELKPFLSPDINRIVWVNINKYFT